MNSAQNTRDFLSIQHGRMPIFCARPILQTEGMQWNSRLRWLVLPVISIFAAASMAAFAGTYLPLATGNLWQLNYMNQSAASMTLRVISAEQVTESVRRAHVEWVTPWGFSYTMILRSSSAGIEHEGFISPSGTVSFPNPLPLFPEGDAGQSWTSALGTVTLVSKTASVTTASGNYSNVRQYRISYSDGSVQSWFLSDGNGYLQFGEAPHQFGLAAKTVALEPAAKVAVQTPGPCPLVGIDPSPAPGQTHAGILTSVSALGAKFYEFSLPWSMLEPSPGQYDFSLVTAAIQQASSFGMSAAMTIKTVDTNTRAIPADLTARAWNETAMTDRFKKMLKALSAKFGSTVKWVHLANEVDLYFINRPAEVAAFRTFFETGMAQLKTSTPGVSVGLIFNYDALRLSNQTFAQLGSLGNHIGFTFYNLDGTVTRSPETVSIEVPTMISLAAGRPIILTEVGYPSASQTGSSTDRQRQFYTLLFQELRKGAGKIAAVRVYQMTDMSMSVANTTTAYYSYTPNSPFAYYLASLGLASESGALKPAYSVFQAELPSYRQANYCYSVSLQ